MLDWMILMPLGRRGRSRASAPRGKTSPRRSRLGGGVQRWETRRRTTWLGVCCGGRNRTSLGLSAGDIAPPLEGHDEDGIRALLRHVWWARVSTCDCWCPGAPRAPSLAVRRRLHVSPCVVWCRGCDPGRHTTPPSFMTRSCSAFPCAPGVYLWRIAAWPPAGSMRDMQLRNRRELDGRFVCVVLAEVHRGFDGCVGDGRGDLDQPRTVFESGVPYSWSSSSGPHGFD